MSDSGYLQEEIRFLQGAIRRHRDFRGDNRCWLDDEELYSVLPEGYKPRKRDTLIEKQNCDKFLACRWNPKTIYVSPQRRIEELEKALRELVVVVENHCSKEYLTWLKNMVGE